LFIPPRNHTRRRHRALDVRSPAHRRSGAPPTLGVIERGARVVYIPTSHADGRSPGDPHFDPVRSRLDAAGITVALHIQASYLFDSLSPKWGMGADPGSWHVSAWQWMNVMGERAASDTLRR
jgi:hypothetical protein